MKRKQAYERSSRMSVSQNDEARYRKASRRSTEIDFELEELVTKLEVIKAKLTRQIWSDPKIEKERLRMAELTLRLEADPERQAIRERERQLTLEQNELRDEMDELQARYYRENPVFGRESESEDL